MYLWIEFLREPIWKQYDGEEKRASNFVVATERRVEIVKRRERE